MRCLPVHEGPFFLETEHWCKCAECGQRVTPEDIRQAARSVMRQSDEIKEARS